MKNRGTFPKTIGTKKVLLVVGLAAAIVLPCSVFYILLQAADKLVKTVEGEPAWRR